MCAFCNKHRMKAPAEIDGECHNFHLISMIYLIPVLIPFFINYKRFPSDQKLHSSLATNEKVYSRKNSVDSTGSKVCILTRALYVLPPFNIYS